MIYAGIDIAKLNHFTTAVSSDGEILIEPFKFTNSTCLPKPSINVIKKNYPFILHIPSYRSRSCNS